MVAMNRALIPALLLSAAYAQSIVDPAELGNRLLLLESQQADALRCEVKTLTPVLDFSSRFRAGLTVRIPLQQFSSGGHPLGMLVQVRPESGAPVYMARKFDFPDSAPESASIEIGGGFLLGQGHYAVRSMIYDETGRACRHEWEIQVSPTGQSRMAIPANTVAELSLTNEAAAAEQPKLQGLTVLLDAAPINPRLSTLPASDVLTLTGALVSVMEALPARKVRLVVFNLDLQKELLREDNFTMASLRRLEDTLNGVQTATADYHVLQNRDGYLALLAGMVNRERESPQPSDAVVFLSARVRYDGKVAVDGNQGRLVKPRFYSIWFQPILRVGTSPDAIDPSIFPVDHNNGNGGLPPEVIVSGSPGRNGRLALDDQRPDSIMQLVSRLKGQSFAVRTPKDFSRVVQQIIRASGRG